MYIASQIKVCNNYEKTNAFIFTMRYMKYHAQWPHVKL